jgi:PBP1b-binding outer membrane lipoprotein LpoB
MNLHKLLPLAFLFALALAACAGKPESPANVATSPAAMTPYATFTQTPTITPTPVNAPTATLAPTATPTPRIYSSRKKTPWESLRTGTASPWMNSKPPIPPWIPT